MRRASECPRGSAFGRHAAVALAFVALTACGCCDPKGQFELLATVVDGPTGQLIPTPAFGGDAAYAKCNSFYGGGGGVGGGTQTSGPCLIWIVFADENGKSVTIGADGYESQSFAVPKAPSDACGPPDSKKMTFRLKRSGS
jgi:hypothetical protein